MAITHCGLRHLRDQGLRVAQQQNLQLPISMELVLELLSDQLVAWPALCTIARLGVVSPPMNSAMPMRPSLPTTEISADAPSSSTYSSDTMESVGKKT